MQPSPNKQRHKTVLELQMINEQFSKPNLIVPQPWDRRQISRDIPPEPKNKPRPSVLLQELQKADARDFMEDGRETKFYYEKYRTVELCKFMLILMAQGMNILSYDLEFEVRDDTTNYVLSYVILVCSVLLIIQTYYSHICYIQYQIAAKQLSPKATIMNTGKYKSMLLNMLFYLLFPYPWTSQIKLSFTFTNEVDGSQREVFYYLNEILTLIMLIRIIPMLQTILIFSRFAGARPNRVCSFYGCQGDQLFRIKCMMKKYPMMIFCVSYLISLLFFAFAIRICERPLVRIQDEFWQNQVKEAEANGEQFFFGSQDFNNYTVALWMVLITLPTVGYGDRFPRTILGRSITTIMAIVAAFLFSILVNALSNSLELTNNQKKAYTIKQKVNAKKSVNEAAVRAIQISGKLKAALNKNKNGADNKDEIDNLVEQIKLQTKKYKQTLNEYRLIKREISNYEMLEREFEIIKQEFNEYKYYNRQLADQEILLNNHLSSLEAAHENVMLYESSEGNTNFNLFQFQQNENTKNLY